jgi:hypothetical protein
MVRESMAPDEFEKFIEVLGRKGVKANEIDLLPKIVETEEHIIFAIKKTDL